VNDKIRDFERQSGLEIYGLGKDRTKWKTAVEKYTELVVRECCSSIRLDDVFNGGKFQRTILEHFGVEE